MHQKLITDRFLIFVNNPKQPLHASNSFRNRIFWIRLSKSSKKVNSIFLSNRISSVCHLYVLACHSHVTRLYSHVIGMSLVCTRMSSVCHTYVLVCHPYVTSLWFYHESFSIVFIPFRTNSQIALKSTVRNPFSDSNMSCL